MRARVHKTFLQLSQLQFYIKTHMLDAETVRKISHNSRQVLATRKSLRKLAEHKIYRKAAMTKSSSYQSSCTFVCIENFSEEEVDETIEILSDAGYDAERGMVDEKPTGYLEISWKK
jgi:hypothetical protein